MNASSLSIRADGGAGAVRELTWTRSWWRAVLANLSFAGVFAILWGLTWLPAVMNSKVRGGVPVVVNAFLHPMFTTCLLVFLLAWVDICAPSQRRRLLLVTAAGITAALIGGAVSMMVLLTSGIWSTAYYSVAMMWWGNFGSSVATCLVAAYILDSRTRAKRRADALADLRRQRAIASRRTAEARLQAAQARVDPQFLFSVLAAVENRQETERHRLLDDLIAYLRAALPDVKAAFTTLGSELALARSWLDIQRVLRDGPLDATLDVASALQGTRFPPMTLIPVLEEALACAGSSQSVAIALDIRIENGLRVRVRTSAPVETKSCRMDELRARLQELYGVNARVVIEEGVASAHEIVLELPDEHAESDHR